MRNHGCRWAVVVLLVVSALFLLQACGGGSSSSGGSGSVQPPVEMVPSISSISPPETIVGNPGLRLAVYGTNFASGAVVCWNGVPLATTYFDAKTLTAALTGSQLAAATVVTINVENPGTNRWMSNGMSFTVYNPAPFMSSISPSQARPGSSGFELTVNGSLFSSVSQVRWNGTALTTTYVSTRELTASVPAANLASVGTAGVTVATPSPGGGTSTPVAFTIGSKSSGPNHVTSLAMSVQGMVWDASRGRLYAALPGTSTNGNSVVAIDPLTGATTPPVSVGNDPNLLALSNDASHLWVSLDGAHAIQRVTLPDLAPDARIEIPPHSIYGPQIALAMQPAPEDPDTLAVIIGNNQLSLPTTGGVAIFDGAVQRPTTVPNNPPMTWLQWGPDDRTLYGQNGYSGDFEFYVLDVDASGVRFGTQYRRVFPDFDIRSYYDRATKRVYADDGRVFDPATGALTGTFNLRAFVFTYACLPDPVEPVVFCLGRDIGQLTSNIGYTLGAFDKNTHRQLGNLRIPDGSGVPHNLIRWGPAGIAFNTRQESPGDTAAVHFIDGPFINSSADPDFTSGSEAEVLPVFTAIAPESATVGSPGLVLTISGSQFQPTAAVSWNGQPLATTYRSSTELAALVPASMLGVEGSATISVANYNLSSHAVNSLTFTVLRASSGMIARNLSSLDIAWDAHSSRLYAPVWSADPRYPNSVVAIDPASGSISKVAGVAPDPTIVRISRDGTLGYTGYLDANLATQFQVPALDSLMTWCLGADQDDGPVHAGDIQVAPESAQATAIALSAIHLLPANRGLAIFDNAVARPERLPYPRTFNLFDSLQWGLTDSVLYAANNETTAYELHAIGVDATGASLLRTYQLVLSDFYVTIHFDRGTGYLYADDGYVTDPATGRRVGSYNGSGLVVPDSSLNRIFMLGQTASQSGTDDYTIVSFDQSHFTSVSYVTIQDLVGIPVAITRWGTSGLAIVTYNENWGPTSGPAGMLYVLDNPAFVSGTQRVQTGVQNLAVGLTWQPGRSAVSFSKSSKRPANSVGKGISPHSKLGTRGPVGRQER
jgi:hypothetical protein